MQKVSKTFAAFGLFALLAACDTQAVSAGEQPNGSFTNAIGDPAISTAQHRRAFYTTEGQTVASICATHVGNSTVVGDMLLAAGYTQGRGVLGPTWRKTIGNIRVPAIAMTQSNPCFARLSASANDDFVHGAETSLQNLGFTPIGASQWSNGTVTLQLQARVQTSGSTSFGTVEIQQI